MLTIWGQKQRPLCDGRSRREFLQVGALGVGGLTMGDVLRLKARAGEPDRTPHMAVIMTYLCGARRTRTCSTSSPPHQDMFDLKPDAPAEFRGEYKPIKTNVPGFDVCELWPLHAKIADKLAVVRNMRALATDTHLPDELLCS